jgi:hypothetical protein
MAINVTEVTIPKSEYDSMLARIIALEQHVKQFKQLELALTTEKQEVARLNSVVVDLQRQLAVKKD